MAYVTLIRVEQAWSVRALVTVTVLVYCMYVCLWHRVDAAALGAVVEWKSEVAEELARYCTLAASELLSQVSAKEECVRVPSASAYVVAEWLQRQRLLHVL